jgi:ADP-ribose pyrophosphatase YjhB (NUDIX family)
MPDIQLIANLVVRRPDGKVLLVRYDPDDERWWLPGEDLEPYEHPDDAARRVLAAFPGVEVRRMTLAFLDSFRGRRGWHVVFHYRVDAEGDARGERPTEWHDAENLPWTAHRPWEQDSVRRALGGP